MLPKTRSSELSQRGQNSAGTVDRHLARSQSAKPKAAADMKHGPTVDGSRVIHPPGTRVAAQQPRSAAALSTSPSSTLSISRTTTNTVGSISAVSSSQQLPFHRTELYVPAPPSHQSTAPAAALGLTVRVPASPISSVSAVTSTVRPVQDAAHRLTSSLTPTSSVLRSPHRVQQHQQLVTGALPHPSTPSRAAGQRSTNITASTDVHTRPQSGGIASTSQQLQSLLSFLDSVETRGAVAPVSGAVGSAASSNGHQPSSAAAAAHREYPAAQPQTPASSQLISETASGPDTVSGTVFLAYCHMIMQFGLTLTLPMTCYAPVVHQ